jgi:predicted metal-binding protein
MKPVAGYDGAHRVGDIYKNLSELERRIFLSGYRKALALGGGECDLCDVCDIQAGICRRPDISRPSMEACGIDVFATALRAKYDMRILNSKDDEFTWFGMILID